MSGVIDLYRVRPIKVAFPFQPGARERLCVGVLMVGHHSHIQYILDYIEYDHIVTTVSNSACCQNWKF